MRPIVMLRHTFAFLLIFCAMAATAYTQTPEIEVRNVRAPATPPGSKVAAVYFEVVAARADTLLGASTAAAEKAEIHETTEEGGMMKMRPLGPVPVSAEQPLKLEPAGTHVMLLGLKEPLQEDARFPLTLHFESSGDIVVEVRVVAPGGGHSHH